MGLYLDGVNDLIQRLAEYDVDIADGFSVKKDIWLRVTILAHTALTLIRTVVVQFLRGTGNLIGGLIHLDGDRIVMGFKDYFSLLIQAIVLPFFGFVILFFPKTGYELFNNFRKSCDVERQVTDIVYKHEDSAKESCGGFRKKLSEGVMGVLGSISAFFQVVTLVLEDILSGNIADIWEHLKGTGSLTITAAVRGIGGCCTDSNAAAIFRAHRICLESFNPSALIQ